MDIEQEITNIKKKLEEIEQRRIGQQNVIPGAIKMRHMGEANLFIRAGELTDRPAVGETGTDSLAIFYDKTDNKIWVYNGSWRSVTLS